MKSKGVRQQLLPSRPPIILIVLAVLFLLIPILLHPKVLIFLGPLRRSLTHSNELVRKTTLFELNVLRLFSFVLFISFTALLVFWNKLVQSKFITSVMEYNPLEYEKQQHAIINYSFITIMISIVIGLFYIRFKDQLFSPPIIDFIIREDGLVEWSQAILLLICSIVAIFICFKESSRPRRNIHILFAIFFFVCFGEEISWGQRIFHFGTAEAIKNINVQGEMNLHNLSGYFADHIFIIAAFFYGAILPALNSIYPFWNRLFSKFGLPIASIGLAIGFFLISLMHEWTIYKIFPPTGYGIDEVRELITDIAFLMLMFESASVTLKRK